MKKLLFISILLPICLATFGQVTTNSGSGLAGTYATLASAITALNAATINGPVVITLAGNETAPLGGYSITASGTSVNTITIQGSSSTITAYTPQTAGSYVDAIFKIVGGDYITIQNFSMQENSGNTVTAKATNTMTEFGVALFYKTITDGAQNNIINNNSISLSNAYQNTVGIYSSTRHSATSPGTGADATSNAGLNSGLKLTKNTITNVAFGIKYTSPINTATIYDSGVEIGSSTAGNGNIITYGNNTAYDATWNGFSSTSAGIEIRNGIDANINYNTVTSINTLTLATKGICISAATAPAGRTYTQTISNNTVTITNTGTTAINGIDFGFGTGTSAVNNFSATYNTITLNQNATAANAAIVNGINAGYTANDRTCSNNNITINQSETTGILSSATTAISLGTAVVTGTTTANTNTILISQTNNSTSAATAAVIGINIQGVSPLATHTMSSNTVTVKQTGTGTFSNTIYYLNLIGGAASLTVNGNVLNTTGGSLNTSGNINGIRQTAVMTGSMNMNNNTVNMDCGTSSPAFLYGMQSNAASLLTSNNNMNNNTITLISNNTNAAGVTSGIVNYDNGTAAQIIKTLTGNTITITGGAKTVRGMDLNYGTCNVGASGFPNTISISSSYVSPSLSGIYALNTTSAFSISYNDIATISSTAGGVNAPVLTGIYFNGVGSANNIFNNTIHGISTGAGSGTSSIKGIDIVTCTTVNVYNNFIYDLTTACTGASCAVIGINTIKASVFYNNVISLGGNNSNSIYGLYDVGNAAYSPMFYYNTVYIYGNPTTGSNISAALYSAASTSTRSFKNNIFFNARSNSGASGKHFAAYFAYTSDANLTLCDYNSYVATGSGGVLGYHSDVYSAVNEISTIADWKTATGQDVKSNTNTPAFASPGTTAISYKPTEYYNGTTVATYTTDFLGSSRTIFSIGAWEGPVSTATDNFKSIASGNWATAGLWRTSPDNAGWVFTTLTPTSSATSIKIKSGYTVNVAANVTASNLTIESGGRLNVNAGIQFTVNGTMSNSGTLYLKSTAGGTATILAPATIGGTGGSFTVENYLGNTRNWYVSSPVSKANAPAGYTWYKYDEPGNNAHNPFILSESAYWENVASGTELSVGTGYVALPDAASTMLFTAQSGGTLNTGDVTIPLTWAGAIKKGFNLIGNPYPSHLEWTTAFVDAVTAPEGSIAPSVLIEPTIYFRTKTGDGNTGGWSFPTYNGHTTEYINGGSAIIPPMQAVWVRAKQNGNLTLTNALTRSHQNTNPLKIPALTYTDRQRLRLEVSNGINTDEALIYFDANASDMYDNFDSQKMFNNIANSPEIYTLAGNEQLAINGLNIIPYDTEIPLGFTTSSTGSFNLKASQFSNFEAGTQVILKDYLDINSPAITNLSDGSSYSFTSDATLNNTSRFSLTFKAPSVATGINPESNDKVWISNRNGKLMVNGTVGNGAKVEVFNSVGQRIISCNLTNSNALLNNTLAVGAYLVKLTNEGKTITRKMIID